MKGRNHARRFHWTLGLDGIPKLGQRRYSISAHYENHRLKKLEEWLEADPSRIPEIEIWCSATKGRPLDERVDIINLAIQVGCSQDFIDELYDDTQEPLWYAVGDFTLLQISREAHESDSTPGRGHQGS